ncbi:MAG TPA: CAP domain-containing protein [Candidatus Methylomirabilis sp.]|nr:CAP domain-containing protein [Candidatus Methylomirabilis sp.]
MLLTRGKRGPLERMGLASRACVRFFREAARGHLWGLTEGVRRPISARRPARRFVIEELEPRLLLSFSPSGLEQEMLELVNRMRLQPAAELGRLTSSLGTPARSSDPDVDSALRYFNVSGPTLAAQWASLEVAPPLAWNEALYNSATGHNQQMIAQDDQQHELPGEPAFAARFAGAGYTGFSLIGENIYAFSDSPFQAHAGFAIDWGATPTGIQNPPGHRQNIMQPAFREAGFSVIPESDAGTEVGPLVVTQDFGSRYGQGNPYLLGVVYRDADQDNTYSAGEGLGGVSVHVDGALDFDASTMAAGGWQVQVPPGTYSVSFSGVGLAGASTVSTVSVADHNTKVDHREAPGPPGASFTDEPLQVGSTRVSAIHVSELRNAVNSLRTSRGLQPFSFTDPTLVPGVTPARTLHILELRQALAPVFAEAGLASPAYTDPQLTAGQTLIRAAHIQELRDAVRSAQFAALASAEQHVSSPALTIASGPVAVPRDFASDMDPSLLQGPVQPDAAGASTAGDLVSAAPVPATAPVVGSLTWDPEGAIIAPVHFDTRPALDWLRVAADGGVSLSRMPVSEDGMSQRLSEPIEFPAVVPLVADSLGLSPVNPAAYSQVGDSGRSWSQRNSA